MKELSTIQQHIATTLQGDAVFTPIDPLKKVEVLVQKKGDLESEIKEKLSAIGLSALVITPLAKLPQATSGAINLDVPVIVQISEEPTNNLTDYSALDLAVETMCLLHNSPTGIGDPRTNFLRLTETPLSLVDESPTYHVNLIAKVSLTPRRAKPAA